MLDGRHRETTEAGPGGRWTWSAESRVATLGVSVQQGAERRLPAGAEGRNSQGAKQLLSRMAGEVEERADLGDRHFLGARPELGDLVARLYFALLQNAEIEARPVVRDK